MLILLVDKVRRYSAKENNNVKPKPFLSGLEVSLTYEGLHVTRVSLIAFSLAVFSQTNRLIHQ